MIEVVTSKRPVLSIQEIESAFRPVLQTAGALKAILYGSYARGEADAHSDIDIIIVANTERPFVERFEDFRSLLRCFRHTMEILVYTPEEMNRMIEQGNAFLERALAEGIVIYEAQ